MPPLLLLRGTQGPVCAAYMDVVALSLGRGSSALKRLDRGLLWEAGLQDSLSCWLGSMDRKSKIRGGGPKSAQTTLVAHLQASWWQSGHGSSWQRKLHFTDQSCMHQSAMGMAWALGNKLEMESTPCRAGWGATSQTEELVMASPDALCAVQVVQLTGGCCQYGKWCCNGQQTEADGTLK